MTEQNLDLTSAGKESSWCPITDAVSHQETRSVICLCVHECVDQGRS